MDRKYLFGEWVSWAEQKAFGNIQILDKTLFSNAIHSIGPVIKGPKNDPKVEIGSLLGHITVNCECDWTVTATGGTPTAIPTHPCVNPYYFFEAGLLTVHEI